MFSWEIFFGLGALVLLAAIVWGVARNRSRNRANDPLTEAATREQYVDPRHETARERELKREVRPS
jgi:hypothetical protein